MSGKRINYQPAQLYMKARERGSTQETAAAKGGISVRSSRRIENTEHRPQRGRPHDWRTRRDPLAEVWESELVPMLERQRNSSIQGNMGVQCCGHCNDECNGGERRLDPRKR
ncbi:MAG: hypothetical protein HC866_07870 [Leptolyngbyaceae cyanobacterium RU_5_1]|nr:hypothetical protein [Leptolyngbyaceae cyanobacterium RU_5_1]